MLVGPGGGEIARKRHYSVYPQPPDPSPSYEFPVSEHIIKRKEKGSESAWSAGENLDLFACTYYKGEVSPSPFR